MRAWCYPFNMAQQRFRNIILHPYYRYMICIFGEKTWYIVMVYRPQDCLATIPPYPHYIGASGSDYDVVPFLTQTECGLCAHSSSAHVLVRMSPLLNKRQSQQVCRKHCSQESQPGFLQRLSGYSPVNNWTGHNGVERNLKSSSETFRRA